MVRFDGDYDDIVVDLENVAREESIGDAAVQSFVDEMRVHFPQHAELEFGRFSLLTCVPQRIAPKVKSVSFDGCASLTSLHGLPATITYASLVSCRRLHRHLRPCPSSGAEFHFGQSMNPATEVRNCMRSGISDELLRRVGPDVALLVGCFATAGLNTSPLFHDRMETCEQVRTRYRRAAYLV